jgi:hypothetical protein
MMVLPGDGEFPENLVPHGCNVWRVLSGFCVKGTKNRNSEVTALAG